MEEKQSDFSFKKIMNIPDFITLLNLLSGLSCIYFAIMGQFFAASIMLLIAIVMDYLDGKVAGLLNQKTEFGKEIDSLSDFSSFGLAPSILGFFYFQSKLLEPSIFLLVSIAVFISCGMLRLARYNIINYKKGFIGMPITLNGLIFPLICLLSLPAAILPFVYLVSGILMITTIRFSRLPL